MRAGADGGTEARVLHLPLEFLVCRALDNALPNLAPKQQYADATGGRGFALGDLLGQDRDAGLHHGGLGRLVACSPNWSASQEVPV